MCKQTYSVAVWSQCADDYFHLICDLSRQMHQHKPCKSYDDTVIFNNQQSAESISRDTNTQVQTQIQIKKIEIKMQRQT